MSRLRLPLALLASTLARSATTSPEPPHLEAIRITAAAERGRLQTPVQRMPSKPPLAAGEHALSPGRRGGVLIVPETLKTDRPAALWIFFHGAGGARDQGQKILGARAEKAGALLLIPESRLGTWDVIAGAYGPDVAALDAALAKVFTHFAVDPKQRVAAGFSDGASYALSLGLGNGDVISHVLAFSPGFAAPAEVHGQAKLYVTHGIGDRVLPIDRCSRTLVPRLRRAGFTIEYVEFDGPHTVPPELVKKGVDWLTAS